MPSAISRCLIRESTRHDLDELMGLWLRSTLAAHPFIDESYWYESAQMVRETFLPQATTWVACEPQSGKISGFISVIDPQFIGALFVDSTAHGHGVAQQLMATAKSTYLRLMLEVYQENHRAVAFYRKEGFSSTAETRHPGTGLPTWIMAWQKRAGDPKAHADLSE